MYRRTIICLSLLFLLVNATGKDYISANPNPVNKRSILEELPEPILSSNSNNCDLDNDNDNDNCSVCLEEEFDLVIEAFCEAEDGICNGVEYRWFYKEDGSEDFSLIEIESFPISGPKLNLNEIKNFVDLSPGIKQFAVSIWKVAEGPRRPFRIRVKAKPPKPFVFIPNFEDPFKLDNVHCAGDTPYFLQAASNNDTIISDGATFKWVEGDNSGDPSFGEKFGTDNPSIIKITQNIEGCISDEELFDIEPLTKPRNISFKADFDLNNARLVSDPNTGEEYVEVSACEGSFLDLYVRANDDNDDFRVTWSVKDDEAIDENGMQVNQSVIQDGIGSVEIGLSILDCPSLPLRFDIKSVPKPSASFEIDNNCSENTIKLQSTSSKGSNDLGEGGEIDSHLWTLGDGNSESGTREFTHTYEIFPRTYEVNLLVTDEFECFSNVSQEVTVFRADFTFKDICLGNNLSISDRTFNGEPIVKERVESWTWKVLDMDSNQLLVSLMGESASINTNDLGPGKYLLKLEVVSKDICVDVETQELNILPSFAPLPNDIFLEDFEKANTLWFSEGRNSSWELANLIEGDVIRTQDPQFAWITRIGSVYNSNENSWVNSVCFDLNNLDRPMLEMDTWINTGEGLDGAVLLYSVDGGNSWDVLGSMGTGQAWKNTNNVLSAPGGIVSNPLRLGWTGSSQTGWQKSRHLLDKVKARANETQKFVRFRIAFNSLAQSERMDGFAFDNFTIKNRTKNSLVEAFTSTQIGSSGTFDKLNDILQDNSRDVISINYHTDFLAGDLFNAINRKGPSAAYTRYGINEVGTFVFDGNLTQGEPANFSENQVHLRVLEDPLFLIEPLEVLSAGNAVEELNIQVQAQQEIPTSEIALRIALIDQELQIDNQSGSNVFAKFCPDPAGFYFNKSWTQGEIWDTTLNLTSLCAPLNFDYGELDILVFLQDINTLEIYQVGKSIEPVQLNSLAEEDEEYSEQEKEQIRVLKIPFDNEVNIQFNEPLRTDLNWHLFTSQGEEIASGKFIHGLQNAEISTSHLQAGIYVLVVDGVNGEGYFKKLIKN